VDSFRRVSRAASLASPNCFGKGPVGLVASLVRSGGSGPIFFSLPHFLDLLVPFRAHWAVCFGSIWTEFCRRVHLEGPTFLRQHFPREGRRPWSTVAYPRLVTFPLSSFFFFRLSFSAQTFSDPLFTLTPQFLFFTFAGCRGFFLVT